MSQRRVCPCNGEGWRLRVGMILFMSPKEEQAEEEEADQVLLGTQ